MDEETIGFDLNADIGEGFDTDERLMPLLTSASVATGAHAGDDSTAIATMMLARKHGVVIGAHPGYEDRKNFGRMPHAVSADEVEKLVYDQCFRLRRLARTIGTDIPYVKPHGALYNQAVVEPAVALGLVRAALRLRMAILILPVGHVGSIARKHGVPIVREGFVDRGYDSRGYLLPRSEHGAVLENLDEIRNQFERLVRSRNVDSFCIHGDHPSVVELAKNVSLWAEEQGWSVRSVWRRVDPD